MVKPDAKIVETENLQGVWVAHLPEGICVLAPGLRPDVRDWAVQLMALYVARLDFCEDSFRANPVKFARLRLAYFDRADVHTYSDKSQTIDCCHQSRWVPRGGLRLLGVSDLILADRRHKAPKLVKPKSARTTVRLA